MDEVKEFLRDGVSQFFPFTYNKKVGFFNKKDFYVIAGKVKRTFRYKD